VELVADHLLEVVWDAVFAHESLDVVAIAEVRWHPPGRRMRLRDVALVLERRHLVANGGGRHGQPILLDERAGADGLSCGYVLVDDEAQELLASVCEFVRHFRKAISTLGVRVLT